MYMQGSPTEMERSQHAPRYEDRPRRTPVAECARIAEVGQVRHSCTTANTNMQCNVEQRFTIAGPGILKRGGTSWKTLQL